MRILFLGGTGFVGRHIAQAVIAAGHDVTFCNRGITDHSLFPGQTHVRLDREGDASVLSTIDAQVVIDTSGYTPDAVRAAARAVSECVKHYIFVSSIDAYDMSAPVIDETSPTKLLAADAQTSERDPELYGAHKARCEVDLRDVLGSERVIVVRAGLLVGPHDNTDRFTYWPVRIARGGEVLAPVGRHMPVQFIDVRDVANWIVHSIAHEIVGTFNLVGTPGALTFGDLFDACLDVTGSDAHATWASSGFLLAHDVGQWVELPLWLADAQDFPGMLAIRNDRARAAGLHQRAPAETVRDILEEYRRRPPSAVMKAGLRPERERMLLDALRTRIAPQR